MNPTSTDWLRKLGSGVIPGGAVRAQGVAGGVGAASGAIEKLDFAALLSQAQSGTLSSGLNVSVDERLGINLSDTQLGRLSRAADRAEAEGLATAVVMIDGQALVLDVGGRRITGRVDPSQMNALSGIDGVVNVPPENAPAGDALDTPTLNLGRADWLKLLASPASARLTQARPGATTP
jgi:hypothetical protein